MIEKVGMVMIKFAEGDEECLTTYLFKMQKLLEALALKELDTIDQDKRKDLQIMRKHARILQQTLELVLMRDSVLNKTKNGLKTRSHSSIMTPIDRKSMNASKSTSASKSNVRSVRSLTGKKSSPRGSLESTDSEDSI